jgi:hypothetical protein
VAAVVLSLSTSWLACGLATMGVAQTQAPTWAETVLYNFANLGPKGSHPDAGVIRDSAGNLYGTAMPPWEECRSARVRRDDAVRLVQSPTASSIRFVRFRKAPMVPLQETAFELRADRPVDSFDQGNSLNLAVSPSKPLIQSSAYCAPAQERQNEF